MIDPLSGALDAVAAGSPFAYPLALGAGVVTSVGPCVAPRYVAIAALAHGARRPRLVIAAFVMGVVGAYVTIGFATTALAALRASSTYVYAALALALGTAGAVTLLRNAGDGHRHTGRVSAGAGGPFLAGASCALVVSPCCTPIVAGIAGLTVLSGRPAQGALLLAAFAAGHVLPLLGVASLGARCATLLAHRAAANAGAIVGGTLMLALAGYYAVLA